MIPISKPLLGREEKKAVLEVIDSGMIAHGSVVEKFEKEFSSYCGSLDAVATTSGTSALMIALQAENIGPGDEVITTPFSFIASSTPILFCGAKPIFVDIKEETFNMDPDLLEDALTKNSKAVLPVHLFGLPVNMKKVNDFAKAHNLKIIEDACQAHGAEFKNKKIGSFNTTAFSFYATKNMACGEGGMITFQNKDLADKARILRNHGSSKRYHHDILGYNFRMTSLQAAIGLEQLKKLNEFNNKRIENANFLLKNLDRSIATLPKTDKDSKHVFHQFTVLFDEGKARDEAIKAFEKNSIGTGVFYPIPIHQQKVFKDFKGSFPVAESVSQRVLSLPIHPGLSKDDLNKIVEVFNSLC